MISAVCDQQINMGISSAISSHPCKCHRRNISACFTAAERKQKMETDALGEQLLHSARFFWSECFVFLFGRIAGLTLIATSRRCISLLKSLKVCKKQNKIKQKTSETRPKRKGSCLHSAARCNINEISVQSVAKQRRRRVALSVMGLGNSSAVSITLSTRRPEGIGGGFLRVILC